jgi:hypothetical protein
VAPDLLFLRVPEGNWTVSRTLARVGGNQRGCSQRHSESRAATSTMSTLGSARDVVHQLHRRVRYPTPLFRPRSA